MLLTRIEERHQVEVVAFHVAAAVRVTCNRPHDRSRQTRSTPSELETFNDINSPKPIDTDSNTYSATEHSRARLLQSSSHSTDTRPHVHVRPLGERWRPTPSPSPFWRPPRRRTSSERAETKHGSVTTVLGATLNARVTAPGREIQFPLSARSEPASVENGVLAPS